MKFKERFQQFMYGRYGVDEFSHTLAYTSIGMFILHAIFRIPVIDNLGMLILIYCYFRIFSRSIYKRAAENQKYLQVKNNFLQKFSNRNSSYSQSSPSGSFSQKLSNVIDSLARKLKREKDHASQLKDYRFFTCPTCKQKVRVPRGKGKIKIHCPRCKNDFIKKT